ncbi:MAG: anthranilate synthase component I family protein [Blastocatellia bacterium]|nr:anthranilate synthase component I family protein [Blastocatellia bacterium]
MPDLLPANFQDFVRLAEQSNVVPVTKTIPADLQTPVGVYLKLAEKSPYSFLLESVSGDEKIARYSYVGCAPHLIAKGQGNQMEVTIGDISEIQQVNMLEGLRRYMGRFLPAQLPELPPFAGGAVGFLGYDAVRWFEAIPCKNPDDLAIDDGVMMFCSTVVAFDHHSHQLKIIANAFTEDQTENLEAVYKKAVAEIESVERLLAAAPIAPGKKRRTEAPMLKSSMTKDQFQQAVEQAKAAIRNGDVWEVMLSQRFEFNIASHPFQIYRALRMINPAPFMYYLNLPETVILGSSHDLLMRCTGRRVDSRTIVGGRPRGKTDVEDELLGAELAADENAMADHIMMFDVARNDMGRVADYGSIEVTKLTNVERSAASMNLVSSLKGILRVGYDRFDALAAAFPACHITGIPKIPAMKLIDELEPTRRGLYGGTVLYLDYSGDIDSCVSEKTVIIKGNRAFVQAGTMITATSQPEKEFVETVNKVRALIKAIEIAEKEL